MNEYYKIDVEETLDGVKTTKDGLTSQEAEKRLAENGSNELSKGKKKSLIRRFAEQLINPMVLVLLVAAILSLIIAILEHGGVNEYAEVGIILAVVIINTVLGVFQESKAEKAIEALQQMSASVAKVRRNGVVSQIPAKELVAGDIVLLEAGDAVPADLRLSVAVSLKIEEAALTGESVPVDKLTKLLTAEGKVPLGDRKNMAYMGSTVSYGRGEGIVTDTGMKTEMGKIAGIIQSTQEGETPLQKNLAHLSKIISVIVLFICAIIFTVRLTTVGDYSSSGVLLSFMIAVSLAVAAIPEGLATVVTIVLSIGVTNMAKKQAIIRRLTAVETLGCAQIICSDKTGTLTQNKMTVVDSYGDVKKLALAMAVCSDSQVSDAGEIVGDPTENALIAFALTQNINKNELNKNFPRVAEAPFDSMRKMMSTIVSADENFIQYTKGAPDEVLKCCTHAEVDGNVVEMTQEVFNNIVSVNKGYADKALRVLAVAYKNHTERPNEVSPASLENNLVFIGLEAMIDPVRPEVGAAVAECKTSGIKVVMITGDHKETAVAIAKTLTIIENASQAITGAELDTLSDEEFEKRIGNTFVYARVQPEHKVRIVNMWRKKGFITAMTGDGVNDAPAIKSGDIGIGMGITGTDVTKNVADMVLADDNFATIVTAVEEGRRIYDNIRKTVQFLLSSNLSEVFAVFVATIVGFVLFKPIHLLFINLITDSLPAIALGMEHADCDIMMRPPRKSNESIFAGGLGISVIYQGILIAGLTLAAYFITDIWHGHDVAMTAAFLTMSMCEIFHSYNMRSRTESIFTLKKGNKKLVFAMILSFALTMLIIYVPPLASVFSLTALTAKELALSLGLSLAIIPLVEFAKIITKLIEKKRAA